MADKRAQLMKDMGIDEDDIGDVPETKGKNKTMPSESSKPTPQTPNGPTKDQAKDTPKQMKQTPVSAQQQPAKKEGVYKIFFFLILPYHFEWIAFIEWFQYLCFVIKFYKCILPFDFHKDA